MIAKVYAIDKNYAKFSWTVWYESSSHLEKAIVLNLQASRGPWVFKVMARCNDKHYCIGNTIAYGRRRARLGGVLFDNEFAIAYTKTHCHEVFLRSFADRYNAALKQSKIRLKQSCEKWKVYVKSKYGLSYTFSVEKVRDISPDRIISENPTSKIFLLDARRAGREFRFCLEHTHYDKDTGEDVWSFRRLLFTNDGFRKFFRKQRVANGVS